MNATPTTEAITSTARRLRPLAALVVLLVALFAGPVPVAQAATYVVDTTSDANLTACTGAAADCSLRGAIDNANGSGGLDTIDFDIPGGGPHAITPSSALPDITDPVIIDGTSEPDFVGTPIVELDGTSVATDGLNITAGSSTVKGLVINSFGDNGIELSGSGGNTIQGNYIGTDVAGTADLGNSGNGVFIWGVPGNTIGGTAAGARNVISGNDKTGVSMMYGGAGGNQVQGNYIGTDASGTVDLGNSEYGLYIDDVPGNTIGGTAAGARNVISGNDLDGIYIVLAGATGNTVQGNYIGTNAAGDTALLNQDNGVQIDTGAFGNTIGGDTAEERNVISGNGSSGVYIAGSGSDGNFVQGNYIGPNATGDGAIGNNRGVRIEGGADTNTVGGATAGERNVISGNVGPGVWISGSGTDGNNVKGNYIGTNAAGTAALPEPMFGWDGVRIQGGAQGNTIGGTTAGERNVISGNGDDCGSCAGVSIMGSGTDGNSVKGNYIGTNAAGTAAVANGLGVAISGSAFGNTIGGTTASERNVISGNTYAGVWINGSGTDGSNIKGNYIGTNGAGGAAVGSGAPPPASATSSPAIPIMAWSSSVVARPAIPCPATTSAPTRTAPPIWATPSMASGSRIQRAITPSVARWRRHATSSPATAATGCGLRAAEREMPYGATTSGPTTPARKM
jgi:titin